MDNARILICDSDKSYVNALVRYILGSGKAFIVSYDTDCEAFAKDRGSYEIALLTEEFIRAYENGEAGDLHIRHIIQLCGSTETGRRSYDAIFKFQPMNQFMDKLCSFKWKRLSNRSRYAVRTRITGIYSPMRHELELPFALTYSHYLSERGKTLFLDIEENSILNQMTGKEADCSLVDAIYEMEQQGEHFKVEVCTETCSGFSYIAPVSNFSELALIREDQWMRLLGCIREAGYADVVILFGTLPQGFLRMINEMDAMYLLGKAGKFYQTGILQFAMGVKKENPNLSVQEVQLPMSAGNVGQSGYEMDELINGNLGIFVKSHFGEELSYAAAGR